MAGGGVLAVDGPVSGFHSRITTSVVITCIVAASSGLIFGYDIGISGGVTTMLPFLRKFFPSVLRNKEGEGKATKPNIYCVYDSQALTAFTSSLYIAGLAASLVASRLTATLGRRNTILLGGCTFLVGAAINGGAANIAMLILGRILLGFGVGFTNQEFIVAPPKWRGAFNTGFQFFIGIGVVASNCINYGTAHRSWGWRLSLGLAMVPAAIMTVGALMISDTPNSLVERGKLTQAKLSLLKARGGKESEVEAELAELVKRNEMAKAVAGQEESPFLSILERQYRPQLVMAIGIPFFQQVTGINIIAFYAPILFQSVGLGNDSALIAAIILGLVNLVILVLICTYAAGFGWSWGPLSWLIPSEIFPMKIRATGQSISVAVNFGTTFVLSQTFLTMLCHFKYGTFLFYAGWIAAMTVFVVLFLPETKGIPLDSMATVWERHWYWGRFVKGQGQLRSPSQQGNSH
ncbi:hypothetical protein G4B88_002734 [Cannabis sativa]|uniref:Major facilitator superfamily (MFS) profile domain-containing protein n=1 Tax=Cannabis sativa TaxID=3483 RepID=A0A7J6HHU7_CANSA|nr:hypothetical protein G4B88_002734 [Cannabis sativa]